ncbi:hypothetical protein C8F04DRAFT_1064422, partial [Mycena alexandri]
MDEHPRIVANCCCTLMNLAEQIARTMGLSLLARYHHGRRRTGAAARSGSAGNEHNFRTAAYEVISAYLSDAAVDAISVVQNTVVAILTRMEQPLAMQNQILGVNDRNNQNERCRPTSAAFL